MIPEALPPEASQYAWDQMKPPEDVKSNLPTATPIKVPFDLECSPGSDEQSEVVIARARWG